MIFRFLLVPVFIFFLFSCTAGEEVNVYSSRHYDTDLQLYQQFTNQTGIRVNLIEGSSDELIERIKNEGINSPADVIITVDAGRLWRAKEAGIMQPHGSEHLHTVIPAELQDSDGYWIGLSQRVRGIIYRKATVSPEDLEGYRELAGEQWNVKLCVRSSNNIYNQSLVASLIETHGVEETENWARNLVSNFARPPQGGDTDQIKAVAAGVCDVALANHYYLARLINSSHSEDNAVAEKVGIYFPGSEFGGTHVNISGAGIALNSPNRNNAVRFLEYLATEDAQKLFSVGNNEFSIIEQAELSPVLTGFGPFESDAVNVSSYGANNPEAIRLMDRAGWR